METTGLKVSVFYYHRLLHAIINLMLNRETDDSANLARNIYLSYSICHVIRINLGLFTLSRLELQVEARKGDDRAKRVLHFREDSNFSMITILWGNVGVNVILALLSETAMTGFAAFLFSTVIITVFAEILPQSYFSRHALKLTALLSPVLKLYQFILCPLVRPTAWVLDYWLSGEVISYIGLPQKVTPDRAAKAERFNTNRVAAIQVSEVS